MTQSRKNEEETIKVESADRRQFLRNVMRFGGAAALLLTGASSQLLAKSLALSAQEMEAARRAQQVQGAPPDADRDAARMDAKAAELSEMSSNCAGTCEGSCSRGCQGSCSRGCQGSCSRDCGGSCSRGCQGTCSRDCGGSCSRGCQGTCSRGCGGSCSTGCQGTCSRGCGGTATAGHSGGSS